MSIKSWQSKHKQIRKAICCAVATAISIGITTYSGSVKYKEYKSTENENVVAPADIKVAAGFDMDMVKPLSFEQLPISTTTTVTTTILSTATTSTTGETTTTTMYGPSTTSVVTSTIQTEVTEAETVTDAEAQTEEEAETPVETSKPDAIVEAEPTTEAPREYEVYKPSTHYIHTSTCRWCNSECYEISSTEGIEARKCSECNPDMEIITPYEEPTPAITSTAIAVTDYEYIILCNLVAGEYGSDWVSTYDKGAVVATVVHRMWEGTRWTNGAAASIYNVIASPDQYDGKYLSDSYSSKVTQSCKDAVTYALNNINAYDYYTNPDGTSVYMINSFCGDGTYNWFRCS